MWTWSPDAQWIAGIRDREIVLINSDDTARPRNLGASGDGGVQWSPDSKYLCSEGRNYRAYQHSTERAWRSSAWKPAKESQSEAPLQDIRWDLRVAGSRSPVVMISP